MAVGVLRPVWNCRSSIPGSVRREFQSRHLKKISFPRICLPIIVALNARVNFAIIPVLLIHIMFTIGLGIVVGVLNVFSGMSTSSSLWCCSFASGLRRSSTLPRFCRQGTTLPLLEPPDNPADRSVSRHTGACDCSQACRRDRG